jgi:hypothetical protein
MPRWYMQGGMLKGELQGLCIVTPQILLQRRVVMMMQILSVGIRVSPKFWIGLFVFLKIWAYINRT